MTVKRYDLEPSYDAMDGYDASLQMEECPDGDYVLASDYDNDLRHAREHAAALKDSVLAWEATADQHAHALAVERGKLEKADAENQRLQHQLAALNLAPTAALMLQENARLVDRVRTLEANDSRYRWLRNQLEVYGASGQPWVVWVKMDSGMPTMVRCKGAELDEAIDSFR